MVEFPEPHLPEPPHDRHWVMKHDLPRIIEKYTALGLTETVDIYKEALAKFEQMS
jgi:hypothetical protein